MEWMYAFLRFDTQAAWDALAIQDSETFVTDVIGPINGAGWHVNIAYKGELDAALAPYLIDVTTPKRVFATTMLPKPEPVVQEESPVIEEENV